MFERMPLVDFERMEILGKAARVFLVSPWSDSDNTGTPRLFEQYLPEQILRVPQAQKYERPLPCPLLLLRLL